MDKPNIGNDTDILQIWNVPASLKRNFKARCAKNRISMHDVICEAMREYLRT